MSRTHLLRFALLLLCSLPSIVARADSKQLPIEHFTRYDEFGLITLSPGGEYIAFTTGKYGRAAMVIVARETGQLVGGLNSSPGFEVFDYDWVSDTRVAVQIAQRQPGMVQPSPTGEIVAVDYDGKQKKFIYGYRAGEQQTGTRLEVREGSYATPVLISPLPEDDRHILIEEHPWKDQLNTWYYDRDARPLITRLDVFSGKKRRLDVAPLADATVLVDGQDRARFAIGQDARFRLAVSWKPDPDGEWVAFELPGFREESVVPQHFDDASDSALFLGVREGESLPALYGVDMNSHEVRTLYASPQVEVTDVVYDLAGKRVIGARTYGESAEVHWLDEDDRAARIFRSLTRAFAGQSVSIGSATRDGRLAIVFVSSDVNPGDYYLFDTEKMNASYLYAARQWIDPQQMRPKEPFEIKARDGLSLHGYLTRAAGEGPQPLIVLPHGGPHGLRDYRDFDAEVQLLASRGYAVLQVNYRGSGGYGMDFKRSGYRQWGASVQDDITDATQWAVEQKYADPQRICIFGASFGGYAALMGAVREPTLYRCAIGFAGVYDLELMLTSADIPRSRAGRNYLKLALGEDIEDLHARSPAYNAGRIQVPVLLIHGKQDWRADYDQATRMKEALQRAGKPFEWMTLSREGHGIYDEESRREYYERILAFLQKHLG